MFFEYEITTSRDVVVLYLSDRDPVFVFVVENKNELDGWHKLSFQDGTKSRMYCVHTLRKLTL